MSQDGFAIDGTIFVEDGTGTKSALKLGVNLAECTDPTTELGLVNVRFADRTYASVRDLKIFSTAIASAQAALSEASSDSISNLETAYQLLENDVTTLEQNLQQTTQDTSERIQELNLISQSLAESDSNQNISIASLSDRVEKLEAPKTNLPAIGDLSTAPGRTYYPGTIAASGGVLLGDETLFQDTFVVGSRFISTTSSGRRVELTITGFDSTTPQTRAFYIPTSTTIVAGSTYERDVDLEVRAKINEILARLRNLGLAT